VTRRKRERRSEVVVEPLSTLRDNCGNVGLVVSRLGWKFPILLFGLTGCCWVLFRTTRSNTMPPVMVQWDHGLWHNNQPKCQATKIQPFREGCPLSCQTYRPNPVIKTNYSLGVREQTIPLYHLSLFWTFGEPYISGGLGDEPANKAYDVGINFQCSAEFRKAFEHAVEHVRYEARDKIPGINVRGVRRMQLDLMNLCCLEQSQAFLAQQLIQTWLYENYPFDVSLQFDHLQCWRTDISSVSNIIMANGKTQRHLMTMNHELRNLLKRHGIPLWIEREGQIPFGIPIGDLAWTKTDKDYVDRLLASLFDIVDLTSKQMGMSWTGKGKPMRITHPPQVSKTPIAHALH